jgi:hypothetical protein
MENSSSPCVLIVAAMLAVFSAEPAWAYIRTGESLDWLVISRAHIAIAEVTAVQVHPDPVHPQNPDQTIDFRITSVLKGRPAREASVRRPVCRAGDSEGALKGTYPAKGSAFLLFFKESGELDYQIDLDHPATGGDDLPITIDFKLLHDRASILDLVAKRLERAKATPARPGPTTRPADADSEWLAPGVGEGFLELWCPSDSPAERALYSGSGTRLIVPADPEWKDRLIKQTRDADVTERARAATRLTAFAGPETIESLRRLLKDQESVEMQVSEGNQPLHKVIAWPARQCAYETLRRLGVDVAKPAGYQEGYGDFLGY